MKTLFLFMTLASLALMGCGDKGGFHIDPVTSKVKGDTASPEEISLFRDAEGNQRPVVNKPLSPEEMAPGKNGQSKTFILDNEREKFTLNNLGHLVWSQFNCKAELKENEEVVKATARVSFYPEFSAQWITKDGVSSTIASSSEVCSRKKGAAEKRAIGSLVRNDTDKKYTLMYNPNIDDTTYMVMSWPTDYTSQAKGELECRRGNMEVTLRAELQGCELSLNKDAK